MKKKYTEIKPTHYMCDYESLFKTLEDKNITFGKMQKDLDISKEEMDKIQKHELIDLSKIGKYLGVNFNKLFEINGIYDFTNDNETSKWCDELRSAGYIIEYCNLGYGEQFEFRMTKIGLYPPITTKSSSFLIAIQELYSQYKSYKETGHYQDIFD